jgi:catechol 2,3-dioxygenase-like lactoylglutathione lyase family enzyme
MKAGEIMLYIEECREHERAADSRTAEFSPCFATDSVKGSYAALKVAGVPISAEYQEFAPTLAFFCISDPDGNLIEFAGAP